VTKESVQNVDRTQEISKLLDITTKSLEEVGRKTKEYETKKESLRSQFFELANEHIRVSGTLETQVVGIKFASRGEAESHIQDNYPEWKIIQFDFNQTVIEEDPAKMKFVWVTEDGYQISRTTAVVGTKFDFDYLRENAPDLFDRIVEAKTVYELNEKKAQDLIEQHPELLSTLQESTKLGKIQLRLSSPKKVSEE